MKPEFFAYRARERQIASATLSRLSALAYWKTPRNAGGKSHITAHTTLGNSQDFFLSRVRNIRQ